MGRHTSKIIGAGLIGMAVGAIAAMFVSPKSGSENREKVKDWANKMSSELNDRVNQAKDMTQDKYSEIVDNLSDKYRKMKNIKESELDDFVDDLKDRWGRIKDQWQSA